MDEKEEKHDRGWMELDTQVFDGRGAAAFAAAAAASSGGPGAPERVDINMLMPSQRVLMDVCLELDVFGPNVCALIGSYHVPDICMFDGGCSSEAVPPLMTCSAHRCAAPLCLFPMVDSSAASIAQSVGQKWGTALLYPEYCKTHRSRLLNHQFAIDYAMRQGNKTSGYTFLRYVATFGSVAMGLAATREAVTRATCSSNNSTVGDEYEMSCFYGFFIPFLVLSMLLVLTLGFFFLRNRRDQHFRIHSVLEPGPEQQQFYRDNGGQNGVGAVADTRVFVAMRAADALGLYTPALLGITLPWTIMGAQSLNPNTSLDDKLTSSDREAQVMVAFGTCASALCLAFIAYYYCVRGLGVAVQVSSKPRAVLWRTALFSCTALATILCGVLSRSSPRTLVHSADVPMFGGDGGGGEDGDIGTAIGFSFIAGSALFLVALAASCVVLPRASRSWNEAGPFILIVFLVLLILTPIVTSFLTLPALYLGRVPPAQKTDFVVGIIFGYFISLSQFIVAGIWMLR